MYSLAILICLVIEVLFLPVAALAHQFRAIPECESSLEDRSPILFIPLSEWTVSPDYADSLFYGEVRLSLQNPIAILTRQQHPAFAIMSSDYFRRTKINEMFKDLKKIANRYPSHQLVPEIFELQNTFESVQPLPRTKVTGGPGMKRLKRLTRSPSVIVFAPGTATSIRDERLVLIPLMTRFQTAKEEAELDRLIDRLLKTRK